MMSKAALVLAAALATVPGAAHAEGPGDYGVRGQTAGASDSYSGAASLTQTGNGTWRLVWTIAGERYEGFGIGDGKVLSFMFTSAGKSGTALYVSNDKGGYDGRWAFRGDKAVGTESLTRR